MSENLSPDDPKPTTVTADLVTLDRVFDDTNLSREVVAKKLSDAIEAMELAKEDPKLISAQMSIVNTYLAVLDGRDGNVSRRVNSKLKQVEAESSSKHSAVVADLLSKISIRNVSLNTGVPQPTQEELEIAMTAAYEEAGLDPILTTELKTDPRDLTA